MTPFDRAFEVVIGLEGGYANDPADPGGATKWGISHKAYPALDISALMLDEAKAIYARDYWQPCHCDALPWPLALYVFDSAINQGVGITPRLLQEALGVACDGIVGPQTLRAAKDAPAASYARFLALRALRYTTTKNFDLYGKGWLTRLFTIALEGK